LFRDICDKIIDWVTKFEDIGDALISLLDVSGHAALPWAGVKFVLEVRCGDLFCKYGGTPKLFQEKLDYSRTLGRMSILRLPGHAGRNLLANISGIDCDYGLGKTR
jgi:hypothetical protein